MLILLVQVLAQWLMDQVPLGHKTPRPGLPRLIHCPACRGIIPTPLPLNTGHVFSECFAVEGTNLELVEKTLKITQVQESEKE